MAALKNCSVLLNQLSVMVVAVTAVTTITAGALVAKLRPVHGVHQLLADYKAANYNPATGTWKNASSDHRGASLPKGAVAPTLVAKATANGSSAVGFDGKREYLKLSKSLPPGQGYTVVAFIDTAGRKPGTTAAIVAGGPGSLEYRMQVMTNGQDKQVLLRTATTAFGTSHSSVSANAFTMVAVATNNTGCGTFYLNGRPDGTCLGHDPFTRSLRFIGAAATGPGATPAEFFRGEIAELQIYNGVLSPRRIKVIDASLEKEYGQQH